MKERLGVWETMRRSLFISLPISAVVLWIAGCHDQKAANDGTRPWLFHLRPSCEVVEKPVDHLENF
jgi:hypothetical protein